MLKKLLLIVALFVQVGIINSKFDPYDLAKNYSTMEKPENEFLQFKLCEKGLIDDDKKNIEAFAE